MAFRETIFTKTLNLGETTVCKIGIITALEHTVDKAISEGANRPHFSKCRQGSPQVVSFFGGEPCGHNRDLHCLFLEQRHTVCFAQYGFQLN